MTAHPRPENYGHWWLTTQNTWNRLHAVPDSALDYADLREAIDDAEPVLVRAACGPVLKLTMPGVFSRFGMPRCAHCCRALGIPRGNGTPVNERDCCKDGGGCEVHGSRP